MTTVGMHAAKSQLSQLVAKAEAGEEVIITRGGKPAARLIPIEAKRPVRVPGLFRGQMPLDMRFFEPLPEEEFKAWEGEE
jgi:prevent-host-death family protein